jgi:hypothetical protein
MRGASCVIPRHPDCGKRRRMRREPAARRRECGIPTSGGEGGPSVLFGSFVDFMAFSASLVFPGDAG